MTTMESNQLFAIPTNKGSFLLKESDIICCLGEGNYSKIISKDNPELLIAKSISKVLAPLSKDSFVRIHKSHFVNLNHIKSYSSIEGKLTVKLSNGLELPVSRTRKENFSKRFHII